MKPPKMARYFVVDRCNCGPTCKSIIIGLQDELGDIPWGVCTVTPEQQPEFVAGFLRLMETRGEG